MTPKKKLQQIVSELGRQLSGSVYPWLLGGLLTFILILTNPFPIEHYLVSLEKVMNRENTTQLVKYIDPDHDGKPEYLDMVDYPSAGTALRMFDGLKHLGQYNLGGKIPTSRLAPLPETADIDGDSIDEIVVFTQFEDSLFLNLISYKERRILMKKRYITLINGQKADDFILDYVTSHDMNNDGCEELYFTVAGLFSLKPRCVYMYDYQADSLYAGPETGSNMTLLPTRLENGEFALLGTSNATANYRKNTDVPWPDTCSYIWAYDSRLHLLYAPVPFRGIPSGFDYFLQDSISPGSWLLFRNLSGSGDPGQLVKPDADGKTRHFLLDCDPDARYRTLFIGGQPHHFLIQNDECDEVFPEKNLLRKTRYSKRTKKMIPKYIADLDKDGLDEFIMVNITDQSCFIFRNSLRNKISLPFGEKNPYIEYYTVSPSAGTSRIDAVSHDLIYQFAYSTNRLFWLKYPLWLAVYLLASLFIAFVRWQQLSQIRLREETERRLAELQLINIRNQLDPHFIFNALNGVANTIYNDKRLEAYDRFERFSNLIRTLLDSSGDLHTTLEKELRFTDDYLSFQAARYRPKFTYSIDCHPSVEPKKQILPRLLILGFAENAVKHAYREMEGGWELRIRVEPAGTGIVIYIEDNGIGISHSEGADGHIKGRGLEMSREQIALLNKIGGQKIRMELTDRSTYGSDETGTRVAVYIE